MNVTLTLDHEHCPSLLEARDTLADVLPADLKGQASQWVKDLVLENIDSLTVPVYGALGTYNRLRKYFGVAIFDPTKITIVKA